MPIKLATFVLVVLAATGMAQRRGGSRSLTENLPLAKTDAEKRILATLEDAVRAGEVYANVPANDGRMMRVLAESTGAKSVAEIGTSTGLSGLWYCLALQKTGGRMTTFEIDPGRARIARENFKKAGCDGVITVVEGDAHKNVTQLKGPLDIVFIDADKEGYVDYLDKLLPLVRPGGLILAHNTDMVPDYMQRVTTSPDLETVVYTSGAGLAVTVKKR